MQEKILRAAAHLIATEGIESASTRAICDAAGVSAPTLYYHFKSKAELLQAVTLFTLDAHRETKRQKRTADALSNARIYWDEYMQFFISEPDLHRSMLVAVSQGAGTQVGLQCFSDLIGEFKALEKLAPLKLPAASCAQMFLAAAQGLTMVFVSIRDEKEREKARSTLSTATREVLLRGLIPSEIFETLQPSLENHFESRS